MYIIVGLGNPKKEYENTRHNIGFDVVDAIAGFYKISMNEKKHKAIIGKGYIEGQKVILAKPQTYMNLSGESVRVIIDYYKIEEQSEMIVIYDDVSLQEGQLRIRKKGSAGGHNGIKNIIAHLGHDVFLRIKMGVGEKPKGYDLADYVLGHFSKVEREYINDSISDAVDAIKMMVFDKTDEAMNQYNNKKIEQK
ncbi:MAG TPA: aminoacyl-tRNA hydrolase [Lachnospiraceae bacterium]|nr:aminoacyl-tRNA hydrolase [Lachnospiraceae bacterium]